MPTRGSLLVCLFASRLLAAEPPAAAPLFQAIQKGDTASVKRLLGQGVSANVRDSEGTPALMAAMLYAGVDCVKLLLDRGAIRTSETLPARRR